jgi:hypothetical protein
MKPKKCPICGADIVCTLKRQEHYFYIENEKVERDTNEDLWFDGPFHFHCSNDKEHPIILDEKWCEEFEGEIAKNLMEVKLYV